MATLKSEHTKDMTVSKINKLKVDVKNMTLDQLKNFRNDFDPDTMGYDGKEGV